MHSERSGRRRNRESCFSLRMAPRAKGASVLLLSPLFDAPPPSFLFSRNRDSWASTKGFFSATAGVYPARPEPRVLELDSAFSGFSPSTPQCRSIREEERGEKAMEGDENRKRVSTTFGPVTLLKTRGDFTFYRVLPSISLLRGFYFSKLA